MQKYPAKIAPNLLKFIHIFKALWISFYAFQQIHAHASLRSDCQWLTKAWYILYRIAFHAATKCYPVWFEHLSDIWLSTVEISVAPGGGGGYSVIRA